MDSNANEVSGLSLSKIFDYSSASDNASYQWNLSIPITIIVLLFLGVYMAAVKPRQGRLSVILPGMLLYISYLSLLILGRESITDNNESNLGLWWVHAIFAIFTLLYIFKDKINFINSFISRIRDSKFSKYFIGSITFILLIWLVA